MVPALEAAGGYAHSQVGAPELFQASLPNGTPPPDSAGLYRYPFAICASRLAPLAFCLVMTPADLRCDGCGQAAAPAHLAKRLQRLEWTTRYRPVHIGTLLLGAASPAEDDDFLYAPAGQFAGQARLVLRAAGVNAAGKLPDVVLSEFQRGGFLLAQLLECPLEETNSGKVQELIFSCLPATLARIRRSLKPKRVVLISRELAFVVANFQSANLNCALSLDDGRPFALDGDDPDAAARRLSRAITAPPVAGR